MHNHIARFQTRDEISAHPSHYRTRRNSVHSPSVFPLGTQGRPIPLINDMRFVMRILGVATARCAKLKLRCLIYRRREDAFSHGRKINCDLRATR